MLQQQLSRLEQLSTPFVNFLSYSPNADDNFSQFYSLGRRCEWLRKSKSLLTGSFTSGSFTSGMMIGLSLSYFGSRPLQLYFVGCICVHVIVIAECSVVTCLNMYEDASVSYAAQPVNLEPFCFKICLSKLNLFVASILNCVPSCISASITCCLRVCQSILEPASSFMSG